MPRLLLLIGFVSSVALAQPAADGPAAEARQQLAAGDSVAALRIVEAGLRHTPDSVELRRLRLRLHVEGVGIGRLARFLRHQQITDDAAALIRLAPRDTLALRVVVEDALWTVLNWHDRILPGPLRSPLGTDFVDPAEVRARLASTRFDTDARRALVPDLDWSQRARRAHEEARRALGTWMADDPAAVRATRAALTLAVVTDQWDEALGVARRFAAVSDDVRADLWLGLALYRTGDAAGAEAAFDRALPRLAAAERARYEDVRTLLPIDQREAYDADTSAAADAFWAAADPRLLTDANERVAEHSARIVEADLRFGWTGDDLFTDRPQRGAETEQGQIWIRYGRPQETVRYLLDENTVQAYGTDRRFAVWDYPDFRVVFDDPENDGQFRIYSPPASAFAGASSAQDDDFVMRDRAMQRTDPQRSQDAPDIPIDVPALISRFRAAGGGTDVIVAWGVPLDSVAAPVRTGAFVLTERGVAMRVVEERRQLPASRVVRTEIGRVWTEAARLAMDATGTVRVEVEGRDGRAFGRTSEAVAPLPAGGFVVSDRLLAASVSEDGPGLVQRGDVGIVPVPAAAFLPPDPIYVYLEAYGLGLDGGRSRYTVEATLRPEARRRGLLGRIFGRGQDPGVSVRTEAEGDHTDDAVTFFLDVRDQRPGRYALTVTIADVVTGATASAEREVVLLEP